MDAFRRAQDFMRDRADKRAEASAVSGKSGISGISAREERDIPLLSLLPPTAEERATTSDHPRARNRGTWSPIQRAKYCNGCILALERLQERLDRDLVIFNSEYSLAMEVRWFRLATRAMRIIGRLAYASPEAEGAFIGSDLGEWYRTQPWPTPSMEARLMDW